MNVQQNQRKITPKSNTTETKTNWNVYVNLPGVVKDNVSVELNNDKLLIQANTVEEDQTKNVQYQRSFSLPGTVNPDKIEANLQDGILKVALTKDESLMYREIPLN